MALIIVGITAFLASLLSFFSGFGLGTLMLPAMAIFVSPTSAIAATAIVHGANSAMKAILMRAHIDWHIILSFGVPAVLAAMVGSSTLGMTATLPELLTYQVLNFTGKITAVKVLISILMIVFALFELLPPLKKIAFSSRYLAVGGLISGFFGGLSGHQGALRSAFLVKTSLTPQAFVGTSSAIGLMVDAIRLVTYAWWAFIFGKMPSLVVFELGLIVVGIISAFVGVIIGKRLIHKTSLNFMSYVVGFLLIAVAILLGLGII